MKQRYVSVKDKRTGTLYKQRIGIADPDEPDEDNDFIEPDEPDELEL